ncbi:MAG: hypothetical protein EOP86_05215 [Verrucomicrobiaceae bacterium]|nr:MAG: hypothetical protein EOP86_05215 [Verrucomicrobiaceae bacterium]
MNTPPNDSGPDFPPANQPPSQDFFPQLLADREMNPVTDFGRAASWRYLNTLHPGNRFRLMFGQPFLPDGREGDRSVESPHGP